MSVREKAIEALIQRRGLAGIFGRPEAEGDVRAIEAVVDLVDPSDTGECQRCATVAAALDDPGTRFFRLPDGALGIVAADFEGDIETALPAGSRELLPAPEREEPVTLDGERPVGERTAGSLRLTPEHAPLRAVPAGPDYSAADEPVSVVCDLGSHEQCSGARCACGCHDEQRAAR